MTFPWKKIARAGATVLSAGVAGPAGAVGGRVLFGLLGGEEDDDAKLFAKAVEEAQRLEEDESFTNTMRLRALITTIEVARPDWKRRQAHYFALTALMEAKGDFELDADEHAPPA